MTEISICIHSISSFLRSRLKNTKQKTQIRQGSICLSSEPPAVVSGCLLSCPQSLFLISHLVLAAWTQLLYLHFKIWILTSQQTFGDRKVGSGYSREKHKIRAFLCFFSLPFACQVYDVELQQEGSESSSCHWALGQKNPVG